MSAREFVLRVQPSLPEKIGRLTDLASNLWFSWHNPTRVLFASLDRNLWRKLDRNPRRFLRSIDQAILDRAAGDEAFLQNYQRILDEYDRYLAEPLDGYPPASLGNDDLIAYFCAEYGYHESFPNYSGGLGILAGDHCKTASDLRMPFVAIGLLYRRGYFRQTIDHAGNQVAHYHDVRIGDMPVSPALDHNGQELHVSCGLPGREVHIKVWRAQVGRINAYLLDTNLPQNSEDDREITHVLYGGGDELRIQQEVVLGVGGVRALRALGLAPRVWHINEGHAAFMILERLREQLNQGMAVDAGLERIASNSVFTTHTPVAAGHDIFSVELITPYLEAIFAGQNLSIDTLVNFGRNGGDDAQFNMTRLALSGTRYVNGVSLIHNRVSEELCADAWPEVPPEENPVTHVTNGVHVPTYLAQGWADLFDRELGESWHEQVGHEALFTRIRSIPDEQYWSIRQQHKVELLSTLRDRLTHQHLRNRVSEVHLDRMLRFVDPANPDVLMVGFARRFATYKRATLLFQDLDAFKRLVSDSSRPVVFVFAGKAHPADAPGQAFIRELHRISNLPECIGHVLLVENYDMSLARPLVAGVDVWLNTPIYPLEASGTSGIKAAMNGTINLSVLDGWWAEGYDGHNGWALPPADENSDAGQRDEQDARTLYELLHDQVLPLYYDKAPGQPWSSKWIEKSKQSMLSIIPRFNMQRVLHDYACRLYGPAASHGKALDDPDSARALTDWKEKVRLAWPGVDLRLVSDTRSRVSADEHVTIEVDAALNGLAPDDVRVECVMERAEKDVRPGSAKLIDEVSRLRSRHPEVEPFALTGETDEPGTFRFAVELRPHWFGDMSYRIRIVPASGRLAHPNETGLMRWLS